METPVLLLDNKMGEAMGNFGWSYAIGSLKNISSPEDFALFCLNQRKGVDLVSARF